VKTIYTLSIGGRIVMKGCLHSKRGRVPGRGDDAKRGVTPRNEHWLVIVLYLTVEGRESVREGWKRGKGSPVGVMVRTGVDDLLVRRLTERGAFVNVAVKPAQP